MPDAMTLKKSQGGQSLRLLDCDSDPKTRNKLETLGLVPGGTFSVVSNSAAGLILNIRDSRLAISHALAQMMTVEPALAEPLELEAPAG